MNGAKLFAAIGAVLATLSVGLVAGKAAESVPANGFVQRVDNFQLADQHFDSHELYRLKDAKAVVLYTQLNGCPIVRNTVAEYKRLRDEYRRKGVEFLMINSSLADDRKSIAAE